MVFRWYTGTGYGYSMHRLSERLLRQFCVFNIATPTDGALRAIYSRAMHSVLDLFSLSQFHCRSELVEVVLQCRYRCLYVFVYLLFSYFSGHFSALLCTLIVWLCVSSHLACWIFLSVLGNLSLHGSFSCTFLTLYCSECSCSYSLTH